MPEILDDSYIENLMRSLETGLDDINAATAEKDSKAQGAILARMVATQREVDRWIVKQELVLTSLLDTDGTPNDGERVARLVRAVEFASQLSRIFSDVIGDGDAGNRTIERAYSVGPALDSIGGGRRSALAELFDHPEPTVRAVAAVCLLDSLPARAQSILKKIAGSDPATCAGWIAHGALALNGGGQRSA